MERIILTDGSGRWFDADSAVKFEEDQRWDGNNFISVPTGSQWYHQWLYYTKSGRWIRHNWSNYQGKADSYYEIDEHEAVQWLANNDQFEQLDRLPEELRIEVRDQLTQLQM